MGFWNFIARSIVSPLWIEAERSKIPPLRKRASECYAEITRLRDESPEIIYRDGRRHKTRQGRKIAARTHKLLRKIDDHYREIEQIERNIKFRVGKLKDADQFGAVYTVYKIQHGDEVYFGLTKKFSARASTHKSKSHNAGVRSMVKRGAKVVAVRKGLTASKAARLEGDLVKSAQRKGLKVHNINGTGGLGRYSIRNS